MILQKNVDFTKNISYVSLYGGEGCNYGGTGGNCNTGSGTGASCVGNNCSQKIIIIKK